VAAHPVGEQIELTPSIAATTARPW
jgi:hypothetical protein